MLAARRPQPTKPVRDITARQTRAESAAWRGKGPGAFGPQVSMWPALLGGHDVRGLAQRQNRARPGVAVGEPETRIGPGARWG